MSKRLFVFLFVALLLSVSNLVSAQPTTIITMTAPDFYGNFFEETIIPQFEEEHPGVDVQFIYESQDDAYNLGIPSLEAEEMDEYFEKVQAYASLADVLFLPSWILNPALTRSRSLLDLTPLVATDASLNIDDFTPSAWESVQWDGGVWMLPATARIELLTYNMDAFDAASLPYPNENWSLIDLLDTAHALTVFDDDGNVEMLGFSGYNPALLYKSLTGGPLQDETMIPVVPDFSSPELATFFQQWLDYTEEHQYTGGGYSMSDVPMMINEPFVLRDDIMGIEGTWAASLLPGGHAGVSVEGFGVSAGTNYPEVAYEFVKFLTYSPEYVNYFGSGSPARRSLVGVEPEDDTFFFSSGYPPEVQALIDDAFTRALPSSDLLFSFYFWQATEYATEEGLDAASALQRLEEDVLAMLDVADQHGESANIFVEIPQQVVLAGDEIVLKFGLNMMGGPGQDRDAWDPVIAEFVAAHPQVGDIQLDTQMFGPDGTDETIDCFYVSFNMVGSGDDEEALVDFLALDPLMSADPNFDRNNFVPQVLEQGQRNNMTYGYPIDIQPEIVVYNADLFAEAGVPEPMDGWDINAFNQALIALQGVLENPDDPVFSTSQTFGNTYLLMLIAAYGGIPYDYRTDPPTLNLTEAETIEATRQVAQLVHDGLIDYRTLGTFGGGGGFLGSDIAMMSASLSQGNYMLSQRDQIEDFSPYRAATYPMGNRFVPVSYSVGSAYIRANAQDIQACYDWISHLANHPEIFQGIPANLAQIDNPAFATAKGEDGVAVARTFIDTLNLPNLLVLPGSMGGGGGSTPGVWLEPYILNFAFDAIMLDQADVEIAYAEAQSNLETYRECTAGIPEVDPEELQTLEASRAYSRQFADCAVTLIPELREQFSWFYEE